MIRREDFQRLYAEHAQALFGFLVYRTGDRALAEDVVADTFERALRARRSFDRRKGSEKTWLYSIALNRLSDQRRRAGVEERAVARLSQDRPERVQPAEHLTDRDAVMRALSVLGPSERDVIALRFGAELTVPEISRLLGESLPAVESRVYRALGKLREELREG